MMREPSNFDFDFQCLYYEHLIYLDIADNQLVYTRTDITLIAETSNSEMFLRRSCWEIFEEFFGVNLSLNVIN